MNSSGDADCADSMTLLHGDPFENNYIFKGQDRHTQCFMIDVETFEIGCAIEDIFIPLQFFGFYCRWSFPKMKWAIDAYLEINPLCESQRIALAACLMLPFMWVRSARGPWATRSSIYHFTYWYKWWGRLRTMGNQRLTVEKLLEHYI